MTEIELVKEEYLEVLNKNAVDFFNRSELGCVAVAVSGSQESLVLLNSAVQALGKENVIALFCNLDMEEKVEKVIVKACQTAEVEFRQVYVDMTGVDEQNMADYKLALFVALLNESWFAGTDIVAIACTNENKNKNGNRSAMLVDGIVAPFVTADD